MTFNTPSEELDALPPYSVIHDEDDNLYIKISNHSWLHLSTDTSSSHLYTSRELTNVVTCRVVFEPFTDSIPYAVSTTTTHTSIPLWIEQDEHHVKIGIRSGLLNTFAKADAARLFKSSYGVEMPELPLMWDSRETGMSEEEARRIAGLIEEFDRKKNEQFKKD